MALEQNNPAARLHFRLSTLRNMGDGTRLLDAWRGMLLAPANDYNFKFYQRYRQVLGLPERARNALLAVPNLNQELYFSWIPKLDAALTSNGFNGTVGTFFATFDKLALDNLEFCADLLSRLRPEKTIDTETLTKIAKQVEQLRRDAEAAKIDESLKSSILDDLDDIASAIEDYAFGGISSLERGVQRAFGSLVLKGDRAARLKENSVWKRFIQILSTLTLAISAANGALQLPHNVHQFLIQHGVVEEQLQLTYDPGQSPTSTEIHTEHEGTAPPSEHPDGNAQGNGAAHDTGLKNT